VSAQRRHACQLAEAAGHDGVGEQSDAERRQHVDQPWLVLRRQRLPDGEIPGQRSEQRRHDVEGEGENDPAPDHEAERLEDASPVRAPPPDHDEREHERDERGEHLHPAGAPRAQNGAHHAACASRSGSPVTSA
jgi:hypothetical protein